VGKTGKVFGVDMTESMISLAERNKAKGDYENVSFVYLPTHYFFLAKQTR
jgi:ubiquinone/menaquinone biosynthesis C-methylase UbiE